MSYIVKTVQIIDISEALKVIDPKDELGYMESGEALMAYCTERRYGYYAKPKEDFCIVEAAREALEAGFTGVVVEDLS